MISQMCTRGAILSASLPELPPFSSFAFVLCQIFPFLFKIRSALSLSLSLDTVNGQNDNFFFVKRRNAATPSSTLQLNRPTFSSMWCRLAAMLAVISLARIIWARHITLVRYISQFLCQEKLTNVNTVCEAAITLWPSSFYYPPLTAL